METKDQQFNRFGFQLIKLTTEQFALIEEAYREDDEEISLGIGLKFGQIDSDRMIASYVKVQFEQSGSPFLLLEVAHHYVIEPVTWEKLNSAGSLILPKDFAVHLTALTIGSIRGVLHCKTENTPFNTFVLPTVNVTELLKDDVVLE